MLYFNKRGLKKLKDAESSDKSKFKATKNIANVYNTKRQYSVLEAKICQ